MSCDGENEEGLKGVLPVEGTAGEVAAGEGTDASAVGLEAGDTGEEGDVLGPEAGAPGHCKELLPAHVRVHKLL